MVSYLHQAYESAAASFLLALGVLCGEPGIGMLLVMMLTLSLLLTHLFTHKLEKLSEIPLNSSTATQIETRLQQYVSSIPLVWEPILFNLAHSLRRSQKWAKGNGGEKKGCGEGL